VTGVVVRPAEPPDATGIAGVHVESWRAAYADIVPAAVLDNLSVERRATFWEERLSDPADSSTWVAEREGLIVGFAGTQPTDAADASDTPVGTVELATIYLLPDVWRQGIGSALERVAVARHTALGTPMLILWVFAANDRARRFYEFAGWRLDEITRDLVLGGEPIPIVRYRLPLEAG
jgi:GNAT superfamily N-acetyltransferase